LTATFDQFDLATRRCAESRRPAMYVGMMHAAVAVTGIATAQPYADPAEAFEQRVVQEIINESVGSGTTRDLHLPDAFLRRVADRRIREAFHQQVHVVRADEQTAASLRGAPPLNPDADRSATPAFHLLPAPPRTEPSEAWRSFLLSHPEAPPLHRGLRVPAVSEPDAPPPADDESAADPLTHVINRHLAAEGLARTIARAAAHLRGNGELPGTAAEFRAGLHRAGFPADLIAYLHRHGAGRDEEHSGVPAEHRACLLEEVLARARSGASDEDLANASTAYTVRWTPASDAGSFRADDEAAARPVERLRLQITRAQDWSAPGDGSVIDVLRHLVRELPELSFDISVAEELVPTLIATTADWEHAGNLHVTPADTGMTQWIRDHAISGTVQPPSGMPERATLVPRYGSKGETNSMLMGGDTLAARQGLSPGELVIVAPLLFQGGNLLCAVDPQRNERLLFVGEAEIHRNRGLGLTADEVIEGFRVTFGVDRVIPLAAPSYHIDFDVTFRTVDNHLIAFVNDVEAAAAHVLHCGIDALAEAGRLPADTAAAAHRAVRDRDSAALGRAIGFAVYGQVLPDGGFPWSLARAFSTRTSDSAIGNFQRFLLAVDRFHVLNSDDSVLPQDPGARAYYRAIRRSRSDAAALTARLREEGLPVFAIPGLSEGSRSITAVNALHADGLLLMPVNGGLFTPLDEAARDAFAATLGPSVRIVGIPCGETFRRSGGLHCAAIARFRLPQPVFPDPAEPGP